MSVTAHLPPMPTVAEALGLTLDPVKREPRPTELRLLAAG
jgi:hypothetical protein